MADLAEAHRRNARVNRDAEQAPHAPLQGSRHTVAHDVLEARQDRRELIIYAGRRRAHDLASRSPDPRPVANARSCASILASTTAKSVDTMHAPSPRAGSDSTVVATPPAGRAASAALTRSIAVGWTVTLTLFSWRNSTRAWVAVRATSSPTSISPRTRRTTWSASAPISCSSVAR